MTDSLSLSESSDDEASEEEDIVEYLSKQFKHPHKQSLIPLHYN
jgi:hypothetical protein